MHFQPEPHSISTFTLASDGNSLASVQRAGARCRSHYSDRWVGLGMTGAQNRRRPWY